MARELTLKQRTFADQYVKLNGNATRAAIVAGYPPPGAHVTAHRTLKNPKVKARIRQLTLKHEISAERVLKRLDNLSTAAEEAKQYSVSAKCEELIGKSLGMWIDRTENVHLHVSSEHLEALMTRAQARRADRARPIDASTSQSLDATDPIETQHVDVDAQSGQAGEDDGELSR